MSGGHEGQRHSTLHQHQRRNHEGLEGALRHLAQGYASMSRTLLRVIPTFAHCFSRMRWGKSHLLQTSGLTMIGHRTLHLLHTVLDAMEVATSNCSWVCRVFPTSLGRIQVKVLRRHL